MKEYVIQPRSYLYKNHYLKANGSFGLLADARIFKKKIDAQIYYAGCLGTSISYKITELEKETP